MSKRSCAYAGLCALAFVAMAIGGDSRAEETEGSSIKACEQKLSLDEFRAYALSKSPMIAEIDRDYAIELAKAFDTETWQNPELQAESTFTHMELQGSKDSQVQVSIGQPLRLSNFGKRARVAELIKKSGDAQKRARVLELTQKLTVQFKTLNAFEETAGLMSDAEARATKKVAVIRQGVKKGLFSKGDESLFEGEKYLLRAKGKQIASTAAMLQSDLSRSLGMPCTITTSAGIDSRDPVPSLEVLLQKAQNSNISEGARIALLSDLSKEQVRLAEIDTFPQITPRLLYQHTNDGGDFFGAGISIPLPLWNQNQPERIRASAEARIAELKVHFAEHGGLTNQIKSLRIAAVNAYEQAEIFSLKAIPAFENALHSQERLYAEGKGNVLQVWQTLRAFSDVQTQSIQLWLQAATARAELSILIGEEV